MLVKVVKVKKRFENHIQKSLSTKPVWIWVFSWFLVGFQDPNRRKAALAKKEERVKSHRRPSFVGNDNGENDPNVWKSRVGMLCYTLLYFVALR